jgi:hypothetical protein
LMMSAPPDREALLGKSFSLRKAAGDRGLVGPKTSFRSFGSIWQDPGP